MTNTNTVQLASVRVITEDLPRLVRFYEAVTGATARWLTDDFVDGNLINLYTPVTPQALRLQQQRQPQLLQQGT